MGNYLLLTKVFFLSGISTNRKTNSQRPVFRQMGILGGLFAVMSIGYNFMMFMMASGNGAEAGMNFDYRDIVIFVMTVASFLVIATTFNQMQTALFNSNDFEFVQSLPVRNSTVIAAKISSILILCIAEDLLIFLPTVILYLVFAGDVFGGVISFIAMFFISLIPLLVSSLLGTLIALITKRLKRKNVFQIIIYVMYFFLVFMISFSMNNSSMIGKSNLTNAMPHLLLFKNALFNRDFLSFLIFIVLNLAAFAAVVAFISLLYRPINSIKQNTGDGRYKSVRSSTSGVGMLLFKKELKMITGKPNYLINSLIGCILYPAYSIMMFLMNMPEEKLDSFFGILIFSIPVMGIMMNSINNSTLSSISLEGKNFELLLSYPVEPMEFLKSKIRVGFLLPSLLSLLSSSVILIFIAVKGIISTVPWPIIAEIYLAPQLALAFASVTGILINLRWPKIDFENDIQVIKNSRSATFGMLFIFLPSIHAGILVLVLNLISPIASLIVMTVTYLAMTAVSSLILKKKGEILFSRVMSR